MLDIRVDDADRELRIVWSDFSSSTRCSVNSIEILALGTGDTFPGVDDFIGVGFAISSDVELLLNTENFCSKITKLKEIFLCYYV